MEKVKELPLKHDAAGTPPGPPPSNSFPLGKLLALSRPGLVSAKPAKGNTVSIFIFPWERVIKETAQIPKESHSSGFSFLN